VENELGHQEIPNVCWFLIGQSVISDAIFTLRLEFYFYRFNCL